MTVIPAVVIWKVGALDATVGNVARSKTGNAALTRLTPELGP